MSKFSSFKESKMLFENWRGHVNEISSQVVTKLAGMSDKEKEELEGVLDSDDEETGTTVQEQQVDANMPPDEKTQEMFQILRSMNSDDSECFNKALKALSKFTGKQDTP
jgi:succinate dehydrogenase flavin-adding protein (antitoxin of CptAB toxin-antitoxin module)